MSGPNLLLTRQNIHPQEEEWQLIEETNDANFDLQFGYFLYPSNFNIKAQNFYKGKIIKRAVQPEFFSEFFSAEKKTKKGKLLQPDKQKYLASVKKLQEHIQRGDIYEINYCVCFEIQETEVNPFETFLKLHSISEAPQACLAYFDGYWIICSSPERFIKRTGEDLITQPIKGTARRSKDLKEDNKLKMELSQSLKEKTENIMIVDVARNDLSKIAEKGTVKVDELCGIYSFNQVHQMISTIRCKTDKDYTIEHIFDATFPMASMTGAPKIRAMQLIHEYESFNRGFYSGSIGVIDKQNNFDFNVVIRSIIYDEKNKSATVAVGSAITALSDAEKEWEECQIKAAAMLSVLQN
jgi:para-aminobenzoate synthetase component I